MEECIDSRCAADVRELRHAVFGNGSPEKSLLVRVDSIEKRLALVQRLCIFIACGVFGLLLKIAGTWLEGFVR